MIAAYGSPPEPPGSGVNIVVHRLCVGSCVRLAQKELLLLHEANGLLALLRCGAVCGAAKRRARARLGSACFSFGFASCQVSTRTESQRNCNARKKEQQEQLQSHHIVDAEHSVTPHVQLVALWVCNRFQELLQAQ
jgi:hypothetical protein